MARPKSEYRNELKTRVPDRVYEELKIFMATKHFESESRAISYLLELALLGINSPRGAQSPEGIAPDVE